MNLKWSSIINTEYINPIKEEHEQLNKTLCYGYGYVNNSQVIGIFIHSLLKIHGYLIPNKLNYEQYVLEKEASLLIIGLFVYF